MWLWIFGLLGAFVYANAELILNLWSVERTALSIQRAIASFVSALISGAAFGQMFAVPLQGLISRYARVNSVDVAFIIGLGANYLWPVVLRAVGARATKLISGSAASDGAELDRERK